MMLAELLHIGFDDVRYITAAQWKNRWNKVAPLDDFYRAVGVVPHQVDATSIALYGAAVWFGTPFFEFLGKANGLEKYKKSIEATNEGKTIKRKVQGAQRPARSRERNSGKRAQTRCNRSSKR
jgi:hypothetical protein